MHEALRAFPRQGAFKFVSLILVFLSVVQFPLTSMASHTEVAEDTITDPQYFYYQHGDHLGSSHVLTEGKTESRHSGIVYRRGNLLQRFEYAPFGQESFALNPNLKFDPSYTGQTYDIETGLYYCKSRYYDPKLARFIQPDTIIPDAKNLQAYNRYSYVSNNPLKYTDPSGHSAVDWFKRMFGAVIGVLIGLAATVITLGAMGVAGATFGAMFANATLGQLVAAGAVAGAIAGSVTGAITGGHMGALMGAAFGAAGGALGPLGNHALSGLSAGVRMAIFGAAGASLSYATGGWKGLATFGAAFAGAMAGLGMTGAFRSQIQNRGKLYAQLDRDSEVATDALYSGNPYEDNLRDLQTYLGPYRHPPYRSYQQANPPVQYRAHDTRLGGIGKAMRDSNPFVLAGNALSMTPHEGTTMIQVFGPSGGLRGSSWEVLIWKPQPQYVVGGKFTPMNWTPLKFDEALSQNITWTTLHYYQSR